MPVSAIADGDAGDGGGERGQVDGGPAVVLDRAVRPPVGRQAGCDDDVAGHRRAGRSATVAATSAGAAADDGRLVVLEPVGQDVEQDVGRARSSAVR